VNVVVRGLMAAGMAIYAAMHVLQVVRPPEGAPGWSVVVFAGATVVGAALAVLLILTATRRETLWESVAAALAAASALALVAALTVGFFGIEEGSLRAEMAVVLIAEVMVLIAFVAGRLATDSAAEVERRPRQDAPTPRVTG
jgi:hypothetical protein